MTSAAVTADPVKVRIRQFQSIEDLEFEVSGFTCITGKTNIGKSAIVRAMSSAILGDPVVGMVRKGSQFCTVELSSGDWGFKWEKGEKGVNRYTIGDVVYDKPGQRQIEEISRMGFGSVKLGSRETQPWLASQFFPIFLLGETGPAVTDFISEVSRLTVLQDAVALSAKGKKRAESSARSKAEEAKDARERMSRVAGLDRLLTLAEEVEAQADSIDEYERRISALEALEARMSAARTRTASLAASEKARVPQDEVSATAARAAEAAEYVRRLTGHAARIIAVRASDKVVVPEAPEDEAKRASLLSRLSSVTARASRARALAPCEGTGVPDGSDVGEARAGIAAASAHDSALRRAAARVRTLSGSSSASVPADPSAEVSSAAAMETAAVRMSALRRAEGELADRLGRAEGELAEVEAALASVPTCPSCRRPQVTTAVGPVPGPS